jgi:hypothetical protein
VVWGDVIPLGGLGGDRRVGWVRQVIALTIAVVMVVWVKPERKALVRSGMGIPFSLVWFFLVQL